MSFAGNITLLEASFPRDRMIRYWFNSRASVEYPVEVFERELRRDGEGIQTVSAMKSKGLEPLVEGDAFGAVLLVHVRRYTVVQPEDDIFGRSRPATGYSHSVRVLGSADRCSQSIPLRNLPAADAADACREYVLRSSNGTLPLPFANSKLCVPTCRPHCMLRCYGVSNVLFGGPPSSTTQSQSCI